MKIRTVLNFDIDNHVTFWCIFLFSFFLLCRKSNLVGLDNDKDKCLKRADVVHKGKYLIVKFRWTKTIQFGERYLEIPLLRNSGSELCPVHAFELMCKRFPAVSSSPALLIRKKKFVQVKYNDLQIFLKKVIAEIGLDFTKFSSHSFRRGAPPGRLKWVCHLI